MRRQFENFTSGCVAIALLALVTACSSTPSTQNRFEATSTPTQRASNPSSSEKADFNSSGVSLPKTTHKIGEVISIKNQNPNLELTVNGIREHQGQGVIRPNRGNKWIVVSTTIANKGTEPTTLSIVSFEVVDHQNKPYKVALLASALEDVKSPSGEIKPGEERRGEVTFEVPEGAQGLKLLFKPNINECEATVAKKTSEKPICEPIVVNLE